MSSPCSMPNLSLTGTEVWSPNLDSLLSKFVTRYPASTHLGIIDQRLVVQGQARDQNRSHGPHLELFGFLR